MFRVLFAGLACMVVCVSAAKASPPLETYGHLPAAENLTISPDGANLALVSGEGAKRSLAIIDLKKGEIIASTNVADSKVRSVTWAGPHQLVVVSSKTQYSPFFGDDKHEISTAIVRDLKRGKWTVLLDKRNDALPMVLDSPKARIIDGRPVLFFESFHFPEGFRGHPDQVLYQADLDGDGVSIVERGSQYTDDWVVDRKGQRVARVDYNQETGLWSLWINSGGRWIESKHMTAKIDQPSIMGFSADGRGLMVREAGGDDVAAWHEVSLTDGAWSPEVASLKGTSNLIMDPATDLPVGRTIPDGDGYHYEFNLPSDQQAWVRIEKAFPGESVHLTDWSDDRSQLVVKVDGAKHGDAFFVVDMKTLHAAFVSDEYDGIHAADINPIRRIDYEAQDGLKIPAYLTTPRGREAKALPLVVLVHGGPAARDYAEFDWWSQALASLGYAVLQPQFRGSDGFSDKLLNAGYGQWGRKMQTDVSDGVRQLVKDGVVDPKRVCIAGGSYGGYAALAGATIDPEPYRCAIAVAGVSDVRRMLRYAADDRRFEENSAQRYWLRFMGLKDANDPKATEISPLSFASRVKMPVLLIHGLDDTVVPYEQSQLMAGALKASGKPVEFVTLSGEDHWLSREQTRTRMLQAMDKFLQANNPPDKFRVEVQPTPAKDAGVAKGR